jgi:hypothetical protein
MRKCSSARERSFIWITFVLQSKSACNYFSAPFGGAHAPRVLLAAPRRKELLLRSSPNEKSF